MSLHRRLHVPPSALWWCALSLLMALPCLAFAPVPLALPPEFWPELPASLVLRPDQGRQQALWSWWTTAWLHGSPAHLWRNLIGAGLLLLMGLLCGMRPRDTLAWMLAWPLTHIGMLREPSLTSYVGLSGVLHAGVVVIALANLHHPLRPGHRVVGIVLLAWLAGKLFMENPWAHHLVLSEASAINVAPWAHLSGALAGALAWSAVHVGSLGQRHPERTKGDKPPV